MEAWLFLIHKIYHTLNVKCITIICKLQFITNN
jgi:hypothetical protein